MTTLQKAAQQIGPILAQAQHLLADVPIDKANAILAEKTKSLDKLLSHCQDILTQRGPLNTAPPIRSLHHLACTGGTLLARCIAAQHNIQLLSEVDPLSLIAHHHDFVPSDMIGLLRFSSRPIFDDELLLDSFIAGLKPVYDATTHTGATLVLRDHAHSHFCHGSDTTQRPALREILTPHFDVISVATTRHPIDAFISLQKSDWLHFTPQTFDEYCRRTHLFLDCYADVELVRYEDFVTDPIEQMQRICGVLDLRYNPDFITLFSAITLSGSSGRGRNMITSHPRQPLPDGLKDAATANISYASLCERQGYDPKLK